MMTPHEFAALRKNFPVKDEEGLNDFQRLPDDTGIVVEQVGINRFRLPLNYNHTDGRVMNHDTEATMLVRLDSGKTGVNMSRLVLILQEEGQKGVVNMAMIDRVLHRYQTEMRDEPQEPMLKDISLKLEFSYCLPQQSLKSNHSSWQFYRSFIEGKRTGDTTRLFLGVEYEYSSTCPCSLSLAHQYEDDYHDGKTTEGNGIATAHAQRSIAKVAVEVDPEENFWLEDLVLLMRETIPTETQAIVKRVDEQAFAILNGSHPIFVEHAARKLHIAFNHDERILDWSASIEHQESLHSHNAMAKIQKGIPNGLRA